MNLKSALADFPTQNGGTVTALVLILLTGFIVCAKLALGQPFPDGYDGWLTLLGALAGVNVVGMVGKRFTDIGYKQAGTSPVTVEAPSSVTVTAAPVAAPAAEGVGAAPAPAQPAAGALVTAVTAAKADPAVPVGRHVAGEGD